ncbi:MAG: hypothetical protein LBO66_12065 [Deltaproteobacteria bacterium]|jgi:hypothetical protein|nr:hypothetical protein [Deltaproteobacteria bacterium]
MLDTLNSNWENLALEDEKENPPFLIDATLSHFGEICQSRVAQSTKEWVNLWRSLGISRVKLPGAKIVSTDAVYGFDRLTPELAPVAFSELLKLELPEIVFGDRLGRATELAMAWIELGGKGVVCSFGGVGGLPKIESLRRFLLEKGLATALDRRRRVERAREIVGFLTGSVNLSDSPAKRNRYRNLAFSREKGPQEA